MVEFCADYDVCCNADFVDCPPDFDYYRACSFVIDFKSDTSIPSIDKLSSSFLANRLVDISFV